MGKQWKQWKTIFLGSKITADGDYSHEIKRCLLLGRKATTNLDSILKSRDITLLTKVHMVKAMASPAVIHRWDSWTIRKHRGSNAFKLWCWRRLFENPLDIKEVKQDNPKGNQPWIFTGLTDAEAEAKLQYFDHLIWKADSLEDLDAKNDWGQEEKGATEDEMVGWHHCLHGHEFEQTPGDSKGQGSLTGCSPWCWKVSDMT